jgi:predicted transcriptional regulator YdeE
MLCNKNLLQTRMKPFNFLSGRFADPENLPARMDTVVVPPQTYLVLHYTGTVDDIGNMRFTLPDDFLNNSALNLGLRRTDGPNVMVFESGDYNSDGPVKVEMWTPIEPFALKRP